MSVDEAKLVLDKELPYEKDFIEKSLSRIKRIVVLKTSWYAEIMNALEASALDFLKKHQIPGHLVDVLPVPGTLELPLAFEALAREGKDLDMVILLGCVVKGGTPHFDIICPSAFDQILSIQTKYLIPSGVGVLTVNNLLQASERKDKGAEAAQAALEMYLFKNKIENESRV